MTAWYNENDKKAAATLRELILQGLIAEGEVDERSIVDVRPSDLKGFAQCHFFAGIGVWSYALRRAGWADDRPVWTGSCPCQPFSAAGKGSGFDDERHLWPHFHWLIDQCRPERVFGEQVASKDGLGWLDLVQADLEGSGYASGAIDTCSAGFGAPHIRQRLWWVAERLADAERERGRGGELGREDAAHAWLAGEIDRLAHPESVGSGTGLCSGGSAERLQLTDDSPIRRLANLHGHGCEPGSEGRTSLGYGSAPQSNRVDGRLADPHGGNAGAEREQRGGEQRQQQGDGSAPVGMADASIVGRDGWRAGEAGDEPGEIERFARLRAAASGQSSTGPVNGIWRDADWLFCRDGKWRPVEPGTFPLAHGAPARVGRLRGYGNAINAEAATGFIEAYLESRAAA